MSETQPWSPTIAAQLAVLDQSLVGVVGAQSEVPVSGTPVTCHVGLDAAGWSWVRIDCDPRSVATDDLAAAVEFKLVNSGYQVCVTPTIQRSVASSFLDEVVNVVKAGHEPGDAGRAALQAWRDLLARPAGQPLGERALVGLFGELEVLETVLQIGGAFDSWTGWTMDQNDFRLPGLVIEVKSTLSANYRRVQIHGLGQLDDPQDGSDLVLVLRRLEPSPDGRSVPDLIEALVRLGAPRAVLYERLSQIHYSDHHRATYGQFRYVSSEIALRSIDDSHPRLVPSKLVDVDLSCIDKVDYELNLNGVADADLDTDLESLLRRHLGAT